MIELQTQPNQDVLLSAQLGLNDTGLYVKASLYKIDDLSTAIDTVNLDEIGNGAYAKKWTNNGEIAKYWVRLFVYTDSGYTTLSEIDRPAEIMVNVGHYQGGGYIGAATGRTAIRLKDLTDEEIKRIAKAVKKELQPELDKKSEFNVKKDTVKTEPIVFPKLPEFPKIPEVKIPEIPKYDEQLVIKEVKSGNSKIESIGAELKSVIDNFNYVIEEYLKSNLSELTKLQLQKINEIKDYFSAIMEEIKKENSSYVKQLEDKNVINVGNMGIEPYEKFMEMLPSGNFPLLLSLLKKIDSKNRKKAFNALIAYYPNKLKEIKKFL